MKKVFFALLVLGAALASAQTEQTPTVRIGFVPSGDREVLKRGAFQLAKQIQDDTNIPITVFIPKSYSGLLTAIKEKKVDFAFLTAASYVNLEKEVKVQVLLKQVWQEPFYYSILVVRKDSGISKIEDLKGKVIDFVDPTSSSGYLYPEVMLKKRGIKDSFFKEVKFSGSHVNSVLALKNKEADAIAIFSDDKAGKKSAWQKFLKDPLADQQMRVIWTSEPIPDNPFCVRQEFYDQNPKIVHTLMFALIDAAEKLKDKQDVKDLISAHGFAPATSRQYDPVRELVKELGPNPGVAP